MFYNESRAGAHRVRKPPGWGSSSGDRATSAGVTPRLRFRFASSASAAADVDSAGQCDSSRWRARTLAGGRRGSSTGVCTDWSSSASSFASATIGQPADVAACSRLPYPRCTNDFKQPHSVAASAAMAGSAPSPASAGPAHTAPWERVALRAAPWARSQQGQAVHLPPARQPPRVPPAHATDDGNTVAYKLHTKQTLTVLEPRTQGVQALAHEVLTGKCNHGYYS